MEHHSKRQKRDSNGRFYEKRRRHCVSVRLSDKEFDALKACAMKRKCTVTRFIAQCAIVNHRIDKEQEEEAMLRSMFPQLQ
jgi:predicted DNA-binding ribbon-helix-helix protein